MTLSTSDVDAVPIFREERPAIPQSSSERSFRSTAGSKSPSHRQRPAAARSLKPTPELRSPIIESPRQENAGGELVEVTVLSMMDGVPETKVLVSAAGKVKHLKTAVCEATDVIPEKQLLMYKGKELRNDDTPISEYGISEDCQIMMTIKMNTGNKTARSGNTVLYVPPSFPETSCIELRNKIKSMTHLRNGKRRSHRRARYKPEIRHDEWTPQKEIEHEMTRRRMKRLLKRRRKKILSNNSPPPSTEGSIIQSPQSSPSLSRESNSSEKLSSASNSAEKLMSTEDVNDLTFIPENKLKTFFEPSETMAEMEQKMKELALPPSNMEELNALRAKREAKLRTMCKVCRRKLSILEQEMSCVCSYVFCRKHRDPERHLCYIDHRQTERHKILKENPRVEDGGLHKAKTLS